MLEQSTSTIIMVRPDHFGFNPQTAMTNPYQHTPQTMHKSAEQIRKTVLFEFTHMVKMLRQEGIEVFVLPSIQDGTTPDAIFPNNWFSHHQDDKLVIYPLLTPNRRLERQKEALLTLFMDAKIPKPEIIDLSQDEEKGLILESTGSMILDRVHKVAFAMASSRTDKKEFEKWCSLMEYEGVFIRSTAHHKKEVYHTNIHMSIGSEFAVVCLDDVEDEKEKEKVRDKLKSLEKDVIEISLDQVYHFCGNVLELQSKSGEKMIIMSETAKNAFTADQFNSLEKYAKIVPLAIPTIEEVGGGGVRCMVAEIFRTQR